MMKIVDSDKFNVQYVTVQFLLQFPSSDMCTAVLIACKQMKITLTIGNVLADY